MGGYRSAYAFASAALIALTGWGSIDGAGQCGRQGCPRRGRHGQSGGGDGAWAPWGDGRLTGAPEEHHVAERPARGGGEAGAAAAQLAGQREEEGRVVGERLLPVMSFFLTATANKGPSRNGFPL